MVSIIELTCSAGSWFFVTILKTQFTLLQFHDILFPTTQNVLQILVHSHTLYILSAFVDITDFWWKVWATFRHFFKSLRRKCGEQKLKRARHPLPPEGASQFVQQSFPRGASQYSLSWMIWFDSTCRSCYMFLNYSKHNCFIIRDPSSNREVESDSSQRCRIPFTQNCDILFMFATNTPLPNLTLYFCMSFCIEFIR